MENTIINQALVFAFIASVSVLSVFIVLWLAPVSYIGVKLVKQMPMTQSDRKRLSIFSTVLVLLIAVMSAFFGASVILGSLAGVSLWWLAVGDLTTEQIEVIIK